jgi:hypothetical protein
VPTAAELAHGRHEKNSRAGGPPDAEATNIFVPDKHAVPDKYAAPDFSPGTPPWQRGNQGAQSRAEAESSATTEVYRPAAGVATAVAGHTTVAEPLPKPAQSPQQPPSGHGPGGGPVPFAPGGPPSAPVPGGLGGPAGPGNGQLPNPFGGSDPMRRNDPGPHRPPLGRPTARPTSPVRGRAPRAPRKASLQIRRFDPWSVLKLSLVLSVAMFLMWLVAVGVLYGVLNGMGVWDKLNGTWNDLASVNESGGGEQLISAGRVFGISAVVGAVNIVLVTAFATVSAFVYNVSADLAGGIEVTLAERD